VIFELENKSFILFTGLGPEEVAHSEILCTIGLTIIKTEVSIQQARVVSCDQEWLCPRGWSTWRALVV
jgi:hypothetical protein